MKPTNVFARQLRKSRIAAGFSQSELGRAMGICRTVINRYEAGRSTPEIGNLVLLANALDVSTDVLLGRVTREKPDAAGRQGQSKPLGSFGGRP